MRILLALFLSVMALSALATDNLRCGTHLIDTSSSRSKILEYCGEPDQKRSGVRKKYLRNAKGYVYGEIEITTEEWVYNRGTTQFRAILVFENNKLQSIEFEP